MSFVRRFVSGIRSENSPWNDIAPVREELFGVERLEQHARTLAAAQPVTKNPPKVLSLQARLNDNARILLAAYRASAKELEADRNIVPAAEWLLDNYHLVEEHIREIGDDLPPGYYRQLPKLAEGPFAGYPRVFGVAWAFVAHTDSHFDPEILGRFISAYQQIQPLTIGELWALPISLRIVLIENLRRMTDQISAGRQSRAEADTMADQVLVSGLSPDAAIDRMATIPLPELFAAQFAKRLRDYDSATTPTLAWLEERLVGQHSSIDDVVLHAQQRLGASNLTVRNIITSMRLISDIDWADLVESVSLVDARLRVASRFAEMDFSTRDLYRSAIEELARGSRCSEIEVAETILKLSTDELLDRADTDRLADPGYYLIADGRRALEGEIGFKAPAYLSIRRFNLSLGIGGYVGVIMLIALVLLGSALWALDIPQIGLMALVAVFAIVPATEVATAFVNRAITWSFGATTLPGLELKQGVPQSLRTLVVIPTLLTTSQELLEQIEQLEVHHLSGAGGDLTFALLLDGKDADQEIVEGEEALIATGHAEIDRLNEQYGPGVAGQRFLLLHRKRLFNASEGKWMGWERKRGKLQELNRLLRGATNTSFVSQRASGPQVPSDVRYVITLDADTRLPRDAALKLVGKMAHPLNRPRYSEDMQRIVGGYGILQPRVTPSLPVGREGSLYQRVFSAPGGIDPYAAAVSDVYQDLFGEGSYTGKGIYDVDAFEASLAGRISENTLLSHDLFEGIFARAGLASDIEVVEEFPSRYDVASKRQHRWTRGDWQLLPWVLGWRGGAQAVSAVGLGKILDNLRRSLVAPSLMLALGLIWLMPLIDALLGTLLVLCALAIPAFLAPFFSILPRRAGIRLGSHFRALGAELKLAAIQTSLSIIFLPDQAWRMSDAIVRTLVRRYVTHRHLLQWTTAAQSASSARPDILGFYRQMAGGTAMGLAIALGSAVLAPTSMPLVFAFVLVWSAAPAIALWSSRSPVLESRRALTPSETQSLRTIARRTWRFFETFVTPADNMLPPDNFQEDPNPVIAHRTSPTNIGLYLLSAVAARDFGWAGKIETVERLEASFATLRRLERFNGHFFNWYDTQDLRVLDPAYVSSVDSGNLAGHLMALSVACEAWIDAPFSQAIRSGMIDNLLLAREALAAIPASSAGATRLDLLLGESYSLLTGVQELHAISASLGRSANKASTLAKEIAQVSESGRLPELVFWTEALADIIREFDRDKLADADSASTLARRLHALSAEAHTMALSMDFAFLLDPERRLLSIGYSRSENRLDANCYDLLASEARLASLFAIAKGDLPTRHWFRLGREATPLGNGSALISWSGSMFEYLMPSLIMRAPVGSILNETNRRIVERQQEYGRGLGIPWGISESAYYARDIEFTYQYSNFGVPGLGLKRGLSENRVIAPYATGLAAMIDPKGALKNYAYIATMGGRGPYGFYEALDFTRSRLPEGQRVAIVRNVMAHHQGMTIIAIANALQDGQMRTRFHSDPLIIASELLLQERTPRHVAIAHPRAEEVKVSASEMRHKAQTVRRLKAPFAGAPVTHLLSNGRYSVMLTATGAGYSQWGDIAVTRWREDATRDDWGAFIFLKDNQSGAVWSPADNANQKTPDQQDVIFAEDRAEFIRRDGALTSCMDVLVSGEDDSEVRRISLTNTGRKPREIEVTSYAELVLTTPATDTAHPAFAKMFVETEYLPEFGALIATRRRRAADEPQVWAAHFAIVEGDVAAEPQYETDRLKFIGRGRSLNNALAFTGDQSLSNTVGTVLDPVFSLRQRVAIGPGKVARIAFWTLVAASRAELMDLLDKHHDRSAYDRAKTLAWTQAQVQLRHLNITPDEAADFQTLAAPILYADPRFRASSDTIAAGAGRQSSLWPLSISGDNAIILLRISDTEDLPKVRQLLRAHEYWRMKGLKTDLVIVNDRSSSYIQDLQTAVETAVRTNQAGPSLREGSNRGSVYLLRADLVSREAIALLASVARVSLVAHHGALADQLTRRPIPEISPAIVRGTLPKAARTQAIELPAGLEFFNGIGGFDKNGTEYVTILQNGVETPAPWINVIANPEFGFQVSATGSGYTWAENSRENQLTPWSNDPIADPSGEAIYIRDEDTGAVWSPTAQPTRDSGTYIARHGFGYSRFEHAANDIGSDLLQYVPLADPIKISRLTLTNRSEKPRRLSITTYAEWVLGTSRSASSPFIVSEVDAKTSALFARKPWNTAFPDRVVFADLSGRQSEQTANRTEFIGRNGNLRQPAALRREEPFSGITGAGLDPCAAQKCKISLAPGESIEIVAFLGQCASADAARELIARYRSADLDSVLAEVTEHWSDLLGTVQVKTPDRAMDIMLNGWLLYQTLACRIWARSGFYQASGAYGFRDQLQDGMALTFARPEQTRSHILRAAGRQFVEGDVQHWWLPHSGQGVRTRISDDRVWLGFATATYIASSGDTAILDEHVAFLEGQKLEPGEHDAFFEPRLADEMATLFEHCARGLDQCLELTGTNGLPLMGTGDWNDGMNQVGEGGKGTSVWLGWLLVRTIALFAPFAETRDPARAARWKAHAESVREALESEAWDGEWYRRATFDDGSWLGSAQNEECRIDSIAQSWAVLSGAGDKVRAATAMASLEHHLIKEKDGLALLFTPPFDKTLRNPGYIKGYPPGLRENGGQYTHAAMWGVLAFTELNEPEKAHKLFALTNPINHALTPDTAERYKVEPYVISADVYSVTPHTGRGGWSWYTGSAGWMYRAGIEGILGIRREGDALVINPCIPKDWPGFDVRIKVDKTDYELRIVNSPKGVRKRTAATLDGRRLQPDKSGVRVKLDGRAHQLEIELRSGNDGGALS